MLDFTSLIDFTEGAPLPSTQLNALRDRVTALILSEGLDSLDMTVLRAILQKESGFDTLASSGPAAGIGQFTLSTARAYHPELNSVKEYMKFPLEVQVHDVVAHYLRAVSGLNDRSPVGRCWTAFSYWAYPLGGACHKLSTMDQVAESVSRVERDALAAPDIDTSYHVDKARSLLTSGFTSLSHEDLHVLATSRVFCYYANRRSGKTGRLWARELRVRDAQYSLRLNGAVPGHVAKTSLYL